MVKKGMGKTSLVQEPCSDLTDSKGVYSQKMRVRVKRERPSLAAWIAALLITMLVVYLLSMDATKPVVVESVSTAQRITREVKLEAQQLYLIVMSKCVSEEEARIMAAGFTSRGAAGYVHEGDDGWYVLGAAYESEREAERVAGSLKKDEAIETEILIISADSVIMRITAPEIQISAIAQADEILRSQSFQLGNIALQLDRGEIKPAAARTLCGVAATEAHDGAVALEGIPGALENELCAALISQLKRLESMLKTVDQTTIIDAADLSGMLRCAQIDNFIKHCTLQNDLLTRA